MSLSPRGAPYRYVLARTAEKQLGRLEPSAQERVLWAIEKMCAEGAGDIKHLQGQLGGQSRLRVGPLRVLFAVQGDLVLVTAVLKRSDAY